MKPTTPTIEVMAQDEIDEMVKRIKEVITFDANNRPSYSELDKLTTCRFLIMARGSQKDAAELGGISPRVMNYKVKHLYHLESFIDAIYDGLVRLNTIEAPPEPAALPSERAIHGPARNSDDEDEVVDGVMRL